MVGIIAENIYYKMKQIKIEFKGTYQIDEFTTVKDPIVSCTMVIDNMIDSVTISVKFENTTYSYGRNIGSFQYIGSWENEDVELFINQFMEEHERD
jgi:hypothetical protein